MLQKYLVRTGAWLELVTGIFLIVSPALAAVLLFGAKMEDAGIAVARFSGIVLISLATACLAISPRPHSRGAALGLLVYNVGVVVLFVGLGVGTALHGLLLWPAVILHAGLAAALLRQFFHRDSLET
jgi:ABC-type uncharacterized transport system permease subunit